MIGLVGSPVYLVFVATFAVGLYVLIDSPNLVKKVIGLNLVQVSVFIVLLGAGYVEGATPPLLPAAEPHANPLPHAIVLTAIVVGVALTAVALALVVRLHSEFGSVDVRDIETRLEDDG